MWCLFYGSLCNFWCSVLFLNRANCFIKNEICRCCFVFSVGSMSCRSISCSVRVWSLRMGMDQIGWTLVCSTPVKQSRGRWSEIILFNALCSCKCSESFQTFKPSQRATEAVREREREPSFLDESGASLTPALGFSCSVTLLYRARHS